MDHTSEKKVSVIIVTAGIAAPLDECIRSVLNQESCVAQVVVIDNSGDPRLAERLRRDYPGVTVVSSGANLLYAAALNIGITRTSGEYVLCLNDDVILEKECIRRALGGFAVDSRIGMVSAKILRRDGRTLDSTGLFLTLVRSARERGYGQTDRNQFDRPGFVFGVNGAVAFYRRSMLEEVSLGGEYFDTDYRIFYEDLDIAWRAQRSGWKGYYVPTAIAYHVRGGTVRQGRGIDKKYARRYLSDELHYDLVKNRYLSIIKNDSLPAFLLALPLIIFYEAFSWEYILLFRPRIIAFFFRRPVPLRCAFLKRAASRAQARESRCRKEAAAGGSALKRRASVVVVCLLVLGAAVVLLLVNRRQPSPNIILVTVDALRSDHLGCSGSDRGLTPRIDALARQGAVFTQAISQASWTIPALASLVTGMYPSSHTVYYWDQELPSQIAGLAETLKTSASYRTAFFSGHGALDKFRKGFDLFEDSRGLADEELVQRAVQWARKEKGRPFFLWVHLMAVHHSAVEPNTITQAGVNLTPEQMNKFRGQYDAAIRQADAEVGQLCSDLGLLSKDSRAIFIITADHGQELCEHGVCFNHGGFLWDTLLHVPLVVVYPGTIKPQTRIASQVQLIDLFPTLLEYLTIPPPGPVEGASLVSLLRGSPGVPRLAFGEHHEKNMDISTSPLTYTMSMVRRPPYKLIVTLDHGNTFVELYNVAADPVEQNDQAPLEPETVKKLTGLLEQWQGRRTAVLDQPEAHIDERTLEILKSLGYLQ